MRIGIDFDNTIVCYDDVFHRLAFERGLIGKNVQASKQAVRDSLRKKGKERDWIELQGEVYGARMHEAVPFDGAFDFLNRCKTEFGGYFIVSHKTERPVAGQPYNLHSEARSWLTSHGMSATVEAGVYFEEKRSAKLDRIKKIGCTQFIDDLPEFLTEPTFPSGVERLLFDPNDNGPEDPRFNRANSWQQCASYIFDFRKSTPLSEANDTQTIAEFLLKKAGLNTTFEITRLTGGVNNRVYKVQTPDAAYALKIYFSHPKDPRDRLGVEATFTNYARSLGLASLQNLITFNRNLNAALFDFAEGRPFCVDDITQNAIEQAAQFVISLNQNKTTARNLKVASEASFSIHGHIDTVGKRVSLLQENVADPAVRAFVYDEILPAWEQAKTPAIAAARDRYFEELPYEDRCISPSDFGFHNAILGSGETVRFVDFEYAGWDDPAHLVCDFFCQVAIPVPYKYRPFMISQLSSLVKSPDWFKERIEILTPIYHIKWCCILLNDFMKIESHRREFAGLSFDNDRLTQQLERSRHLLESVTCSSAVARPAE